MSTNQFRGKQQDTAGSALSARDNDGYEIRNAKQEEFEMVGQLMVHVYSQLDNFPTETEQPEYYRLLRNVGSLTQKEQVEVLVAVSESGDIDGAVVYFGDMIHYGSGGTATKETNAAGFRLLAVNPATRGRGLGKRLTQQCIEKARYTDRRQIIIHTTRAMQTAWKMYEGLGFIRSEDLDFMQASLPVFGFRLTLNQAAVK